MFGRSKEYNSIGDIFTDYLFHDMRNPIVQNEVLLKCYNFLVDKVRTDEDFQLFNIDIKFDKEGDLLNLKGNNLISSLWLIGIYPKNPNELKDRLSYSIKNIDYIYNPKNKKLTILKN